MSNELGQLKKVFKAEGQPLPREEVRKEDISRAMQAFDAEHGIDRQGSAASDRLKNTGNTVFNFLSRRRFMESTRSNLKPVLLGGVSLAVLSIAVLNTQYLKQTITPSQDQMVASAPVPQSSQLEKAAESPDDVAVPSKEITSRLTEVRRNDADGNRAPAPDLAQQPSVAVGDEAEVGRANQSRAEVDKVAPAEEPAADTKTEAKIRDMAEALQSNEMFGFAGKQKRHRAARRKGFADNRAKPVKRNSAKVAKPQSLNGQGAIGFLNNAAPSAGTVRRQQEIYRNLGTSSDAQNKTYYEDQGRDKFEDITPNPTKVVKEEPVSTFSIDVDTASYGFVRASLNNNVLPQKDAVRIEELINYFPYDYATPNDKAEPFRTHVSVMPTPWNTNTKLLHIGIKGYELPATGERPPANLVFLLDVSGSMNAPNKLPLLRKSFKLLLSNLQPDDTIAIVTYAGRAGTALEPTKVRDKTKIIAALDQLRSGGSTAGAEGIRQAYQLAERNYNKDGINRVILATDGDFNVGITNREELKSFIERKRKTGVTLSVLGFGMGNYNDALMQTLAQNGNGNAAYIDTLSEARKTLVEEVGSTLFTIAKDVKIQIEFNPQTVAEYRLIGYETRLLKREDFNNDKVDAGDIGAGHTVTAIYEITPVESPARLVDDLRYQTKKKADVTAGEKSNEYAFLKLRYKLPDSDTSTLITTPVSRDLEVDGIAAAPQDTRFATAVAAFGQLLRGGRFTGSYSYDDVIKLAQGAKGEDEFGYRAEFINLVRFAKSAAALQPLKQ